MDFDIDKLRTLPGETQEEFNRISAGILALAKIEGSTMLRELKFRVRYHGKIITKSLNDMLVDPANNFMFLDGEIMLEPAEALELLKWLSEHKDDLERLAKEQEEGKQ